MSDRFDELRRRLGELTDVEKAASLLAWDEETKMPPGGAEARAEQRATLERIAHELQTAPELGRLLDELADFEAAHDFDSFEASLVRVARRDYEKATRVPAELRAELTRAASRGYRAWLAAREANDYSLMLPHLEHQVELRRRYVDCFPPQDDPYDVLLDDYEPGMKTAEVEAVFDRLKAALVPMIRAVEDAEPVDDACLRGPFSRTEQRRFSLWALAQWGVDEESWRLDRTVHPFADSLSPTDIRLTTNFREEHIGGIVACLHEYGHGIYERQVDPSLARTPLGTGVSAAFHESQSRMWENLVGRSLACWTYFYPRLQEEMPRFADVPLETFHRAINKVQRSYTRVEADEVTYCLHIILRFELEREMLSGALAPRDLPDAFDAKMREYLGLQPPDLQHGALQDVHWSDSGFGYFPTYAIGNVVSVQLWERAEADLGDMHEQFEQGDFAQLRDWLGEHVHRHGRKFTPQETLERAVGTRTIDPEPYLEYLRGKLEALFGAVVA